MICKDNSSPTYYCDDTDLCWLESVNKQKLKGLLRSSAMLGLLFYASLNLTVFHSN